MDEKQPVSEETKKNLSELTLMNLGVVNEKLDLLKVAIADLDKLSAEESFEMPAVAEQIRLMRRIYEYMILIGLISNDMAVAYRIYLRAEDPYEVQYATKHIVITMTEGYKQIYNFISVNEKGDMVTAKRNRSIWKKDIGEIVAGKVPDLLMEYQAITADLESFDDAVLKAMHKPRNIFVHYDHKPLVALDHLLDVHIEEVTQKAIPFMAILQRMLEFNSKLVVGFHEYPTRVVREAFVEHQGILENMRAENIHSPAIVANVDEGLANLARMKRDYETREAERLSLK